jgi:GT2 family glycosyltransferase
MDKRLEISVIIVNYNTHGYILLTLESVFRAIKNFKTEVIVVDNASTDGSVAEVQRYYPQTAIIQNPRNAGFAVANNIGLRRARGDFVLLLNPDTVVPGDVFELLVAFMNKNPDVGVAGCKILNADCTFSVDSRHSVPSPMTALWKQLGFNRLFPKSKIFGRYNLTYLDPDETYPVDAISGSFMFLRRQIIEQVGLLDEEFFMYGEDLDYCYRINQTTWKVYYFAGTVILHYKGESTNKNTFRYSWNFSRSLFLFYRKHFRYHFSFLMHGIVLLGVSLRSVLVFLKNNSKNIFKVIRHGLAKFRTEEKKMIWIGSITDFESSQEILKSFGYQITGIISTEPSNDTVLDIPVLGHIQKIDEFIPPSGRFDLIFDAEQLSFKSIISTMSILTKWKMNYRIFLSGKDILIGK